MSLVLLHLEVQRQKEKGREGNFHLKSVYKYYCVRDMAINPLIDVLQWTKIIEQGHWPEKKKKIQMLSHFIRMMMMIIIIHPCYSL